jgi:hypothetical protein
MKMHHQLSIVRIMFSSFVVMIAVLIGGEALAGSLSNGLAGYWQFNGDGTDVSGNGNNVALYGGTGYGTGLFGQALTLDGMKGSYAQVTNNTAFDLGTGDFTIQVWANLNSATSVDGEAPVLVEKFIYGGGPGWTFYSMYSRPEFYSNSTSLIMTGSVTIPNNKWQQYLIERSGNTFTMYFDGNPVATASFSGSVGGSPNPMLIGARNAEDGRNLTLNGLIDETAIWNRALSPTEIASLWNDGSGLELSSTVPEPSIWLLLAMGCSQIFGLRRMFRKQSSGQ